MAELLNKIAFIFMIILTTIGEIWDNIKGGKHFPY